ncbi:uncharacterized protein CTHT_0053480 [Thermochaetoides thermophila DSM 1495]|uniref:Uncharacterized protein n=1 Tax=Chaetomium thermophilum (strain DSM 1495 / CBS 144.50 / IMI 039719) TaxID=759272 RepID=G0SDY8_CHATD|nr:hypothetical protein CTHT_0053480 [Thermochaetoides thermophila DSM 1495]EGS18739.1 hypothetical protein CTHT_0053480 [Thermochaetoides thermophila DSM 1495]
MDSFLNFSHKPPSRFSPQYSSMTDVAWQQTDDLPYSSSSSFYTAPELDYSHEPQYLELPPPLQQFPQRSSSLSQYQRQHQHQHYHQYHHPYQNQYQDQYQHNQYTMATVAAQRPPLHVTIPTTPLEGGQTRAQNDQRDGQDSDPTTPTQKQKVKFLEDDDDSDSKSDQSSICQSPSWEGYGKKKKDKKKEKKQVEKEVKKKRSPARLSKLPPPTTPNGSRPSGLTNADRSKSDTVLSQNWQQGTLRPGPRLEDIGRAVSTDDFDQGENHWTGAAGDQASSGIQPRNVPRPPRDAYPPAGSRTPQANSRSQQGSPDRNRSQESLAGDGYVLQHRAQATARALANVADEQLMHAIENYAPSIHELNQSSRRTSLAVDPKAAALWLVGKRPRSRTRQDEIAVGDNDILSFKAVPYSQSSASMPPPKFVDTVPNKGKLSPEEIADLLAKAKVKDEKRAASRRASQSPRQSPTQRPQDVAPNATTTTTTTTTTTATKTTAAASPSSAPAKSNETSQQSENSSSSSVLGDVSPLPSRTSTPDTSRPQSAKDVPIFGEQAQDKTEKKGNGQSSEQRRRQGSDSDGSRSSYPIDLDAYTYVTPLVLNNEKEAQASQAVAGAASTSAPKPESQAPEQQQQQQQQSEAARKPGSSSETPDPERPKSRSQSLPRKGKARAAPAPLHLDGNNSDSQQLPLKPALKSPRRIPGSPLSSAAPSTRASSPARSPLRSEFSVPPPPPPPMPHSPGLPPADMASLQPPSFPGSRPTSSHASGASTPSQRTSNASGPVSILKNGNSNGKAPAAPSDALARTSGLPRHLQRPGTATPSSSTSGSNPGMMMSMPPAMPVGKMFVECCNCHFYHDMPAKIYECMARPDAVVVADEESGLSGQVTTMVRCPWCGHPMSRGCCAGYVAVVYIKERLH